MKITLTEDNGKDFSTYHLNGAQAKAFLYNLNVPVFCPAYFTEMDARIASDAWESLESLLHRQIRKDFPTEPGTTKLKKHHESKSPSHTLRRQRSDNARLANELRKKS